MDFNILCPGLPILAKFPTAGKMSKYRVSSGPNFPVFGLNTEIHSVNLRIQSEYGKILTRKKSVSGHFSRSAIASNSFCCNSQRCI